MRRYRILGTEIVLDVCRGVYDPSDDSFLLMEKAEPHGRVLEIGSGSGIISVFYSLRGLDVTSVDVNRTAVECTLRNASINGTELKAEVSDLFSSVEGKYDTIIFNPPYLPTEDGFGGSEQWDGGPDGFKVTRPFLSALPEYLEDRGECFLILSSLTDMETLISEFKNLSFSEIGRSEFTFETIFLYRISIH